jgi:hypothetical protein
LVSILAFNSWEMQPGDPAFFAFTLAPLPNPHDNDPAMPEERESWGAFTLWAGGAFVHILSKAR